MYCKYCGTSLPDTARFCSECGAMQEERSSQKTEVSFDDTYFEEAPVADVDEKNATMDDVRTDDPTVGKATMGYSAHSDGYNNSYRDYQQRQAESGGMQYYAPPVDDNPLLTQRSTGITVLCFILPLIGLILWLIWKNTKPGLAVSASKGALAGLCLGTPILGLVLWLVWRDNNKEMANPCGIAALVGVILSFLLPIFLIFFVLVFSIIFEETYYGIALATLLL